MQIQLSPYVIPLVLCAAVAAGLTLFALRHHDAPAALPVTALLFEITLWIVLYTLEFSAPTLQDKLTWARLAYLTLVCIPPTWLVFTVQYTRKGKRVRILYQAALLILPVLTLILAATNPQHHLFWMEGGWNGNYISLVYPLWLWIHIVSSYTVL
ncbi:hypothetical protein EHM76_01720, partial [bacterium]